MATLRKVYLDNAATTPLSTAARAVYQNDELMSTYGNPSSLHFEGVKAARLLDESRIKIAKCLNCSPNELFFTSGATESNNWFLNSVQGLSKYFPSKNAKRHEKVIFTSNVEHHSILEPFKKNMDSSYRFIPVNCNSFSSSELDYDFSKVGIVLPDEKMFSKPLHGCKIYPIVSLMMVNNEIGTINPIKEIASYVHTAGGIIHTDATQAVGHIPVDIKALDVDALTFSAHKFGGPKGVGCLYIKKSKQYLFSPFIYGGGQERQFRSGTENVVGITAMAAALEEATKQMRMVNCLVAPNVLYQHYREDCIKALSECASIAINGADYIQDGKYHPSMWQYPGILNISIDGVEAESLVSLTSMCGVYISTGSACNSHAVEPSYVLKAIGLSDEKAFCSVRISFGPQNLPSDINYAIKSLTTAVKILKKENMP